MQFIGKNKQGKEKGLLGGNLLCQKKNGRKERTFNMEGI